jgi:hypothetical protein
MSIFPMEGNQSTCGENPRLSAALTDSFHNHESVARIEPTNSNVQGACSDDCFTESPRATGAPRYPCNCRCTYTTCMINDVNSCLKRFCLEKKWASIEHSNITASHLNRSGIHLNRTGTTLVARNFNNNIYKTGFQCKRPLWRRSLYYSV